MANAYKSNASEWMKNPKRGDVWRTDDGKVCLVVDSVGYSSEWDCSVVTFWRSGVHDTCEQEDFGLLLTSLNASFVDRLQLRLDVAREEK